MIALVWGKSLASVVSALIVDRPSLAPRLVLAPRRVVHALAAYVHHAVETQYDIQQIAREIEQQDVRALLACAIPNPHPRLCRMLDRLGPAALDMSVYQRLNAVLHGPAADLLLDADEITDSRLNVVTQIVADPVLLAARKAIGWSAADLQYLQLSLAYLRAKGLANDIEKLPPGSGWRAVLRRISSDLGRARAPKLGFEAPAGWRHVADVADLWRVGTALGNCAASIRSGGEGYVDQLITGDAVYLARDAEPAMLACVRGVGPNLWTLAETTMSRTGSDVMKARQALHTDLMVSIAKTGGELLIQSPLSAIRSIAWRVEHDGDDDLDDLEDVA
jgi:hypothetical protein